jgi:hypothetical protein
VVVNNLRDRGYEVTDLTKKGWTPTPPNISSLQDELNALDDGSIVVADLLGNVTYRFEQLDGTLAMPYKVDGKYHLGVQVKVCSWPVFRTLVTALKPALETIKGKLIFLSPLPRYLHHGCCKDEEHCVGVGTSPYMETNLREIIALRNICIDQLEIMGMKTFLVPDMIPGMMPACTGIKEYCTALSHLTAADGVHLTQEGYRKVADTIVDSKFTAKPPTAACPIVPGSSHGGNARVQCEFYWRGFMSPVGTARPKNKADAYKQTHGGGKWDNFKPPNNRGHATTPYRGRGGGGGYGRGKRGN